MARKFKNLGKILALFALSVYETNLYAYCDDFCFPPLYMGVDAQIRHMPFKKNYGGNVLSQNYPQGNLYFGLKANNYIGMEIGYEFSRTRTRSIAVPPRSVLFGIAQPFETRQNLIVKFKSLHASLIGFFPCCFFDENLNILAGVGIAHDQMKIQGIVTSYANRTPPRKIGLNLVSSKYVLRLMTGVQYMFNDYLGVRANLRFENTSVFNNISPLRAQSICMAKAQNSIIFGLGAVFQF